MLGSQLQHPDGEMTDYESKRLKNIQRNMALMMEIGMSAAKLSARTSVDNKAAERAKAQQMARKRAQLAARLNQPQRKSQRLAGNSVKVQQDERFQWSEDLVLRGDTLHVLEKEPPKPRKKRRKLYDPKHHVMAKECKEFLENMTTEPVEEDRTLDDEDEDGVEYSLADDDVVQIGKHQLLSMAFLPRADRIAVACGSKKGRVTLWSPSNGAQDSASLMVNYKAHSRPVTQLIFSDSSKLISASADRTVREFDLHAATSSLVFRAGVGVGICSLTAASTPKCYYASCRDGTVKLIDRRVGRAQSASYPLHKLRTNTVHQHPSRDFCIATASLDSTVCLWDARTMSSNENTPLVTLPRDKNVNCAYFSPRSGEWLVTVGKDSYIDMLNTSSLTTSDTSPITLSKPTRIQHRTNTAAWITPLHAAWDPKRPNQFAIGSIGKPRQVQIFQAGRKDPIRELTSDKLVSVHSVNVFHPYLELIAGCNTYGQLALWRGASQHR